MPADLFADISEFLAGKPGIYALYDKKGSLWYVGLAKDLRTRLSQHLTDKHSGKWTKFKVFVVPRQKLILEFQKEGKNVGVMTTGENHHYKLKRVKFVGSTFEGIARNLFKTFREFDNEMIDIIIVEGIEDKGLGLAIMNRLRKASIKK